MADGLSFTDRLSNLFSSNGINTRRNFTYAINDSLQLISNFTTPPSTTPPSLATYGPFPTARGENVTNASPTREQTSIIQTETPIAVTENQLFASINLEVSFRMFYSLALILLIILGIVGNLLVLVTILRKTPLWVTKQATNVLLFNLSIAHLLFLIIGALPGIFGTILGKSPLDSLSCRIQGSLLMAAFLASTSTVGIISIDRFIGVNWTRHYAELITMDLLVTSCFISWIPGTISGIYLVAHSGWINYDSRAGFCDLAWDGTSPNPLTWSTLTFVLLFLVPAASSLLLILPTLGVLLVRRIGNRVQTTSTPAPPRPRFAPNNDEYFMTNKTYSPEFQHSGVGGVLNQLKNTITPRRAPNEAAAVPRLETLRNELFTKVEARASRHAHVFGSMEQVVEVDESQVEQESTVRRTVQTQSRANLDAKELTTSLLMILLFFILLVSPAVIVRIDKYASHHYLPLWTISVSTLLVFGACVVNPIIYFYSRSDFRDSFINLYSSVQCCPFDD